jgi:hypothetical protein
LRGHGLKVRKVDIGGLLVYAQADLNLMPTKDRKFPARFLTCALLMAAANVLGSDVGDSYDKVLAEKGAPKSQMQAGTVRILTYPDVTIKLKDDVVVSIKAVVSVPSPPSPPPNAAGKPPTAADSVASLKNRLKDSMTRVNLIVNQPVATVPLTPELRAAIWGEGWFHPGAITPDFNTVDIRKTQETEQYAKFEFISSNLNPGVAFRGADVEFNSMTKFFYVDRTLPKKRLTEEEMVEINRLYKVIGNCERQLQLWGAAQ